MRNILTILICLSALNINAQEEVKSIIERVNNAQYIFEGRIIYSSAYEKSDEKDIYTTNTIQITKVFKGDLQCGKVELISSGGRVNEKIRTNSHLLALKEGYTGIFLCGINNKEAPQIDYIVEENTEKLSPIFENQSFIKYYYEGLKLVASDVTFNYDSLIKVYNLINLVTQFNYIDCNNESTIIYNNNNTNSTKIIPYNPMPHIELSNITKAQFDNLVEQKIAITKSSGRSISASGNVSFSITNPIISGTNPKYFEFDVNIGADAGKYLTNAAVRFNYSNSAFGNNIKANNKMTVTRGTIVGNSSEYPYILISDLSPNIVGIGVSSGLTPSNLSEYSPTMEQLWHIRIELQNCNTNANIQFTHQDTMLSATFYDISPSGTNLLEFATIAANQTQSIPACKPTITSFSPNPINGGVGEQLVIKGFQFGDEPNLFFPNANDGGMSKIAINRIDFLPFGNNDTMITITMPSFNDTITLNGTTLIAQPASTPGSGKFIVEDNNGVRDTSDTPLSVFYSVDNYPFPIGGKRLANLIKKDANGGYEFKVDTALWNHPERKACVIKAVEEWKCLTGVKWDVVGSIVPPSDSGSTDNNNIIQLGITDSSPLGVVLANTSNNKKDCSNKLIASELDLVFNRTVDWWYDTTSTQPVPTGKKDFYATILHELGHAHSLFHIIDPNAIMHWDAQPTGPLPANQRKIHLTNDASCAFGGDKVMVRSLAVGTLNCAYATVPITRQYICVPFTSIQTTEEERIEFSVYPNPFINKITFDYSIAKDAQMDIYLMDYEGRIFAKDDTKQIKAGSYRSEILVDDIPSGQYIIWGHINGKVFYKNLICISK